MSNWYQELEEYLSKNFIVYLGLMEAIGIIIILLFVCCLIHVLRGTRHSFIIWMNIAIISECIIYILWFYTQYKKWNFISSFLWYASFTWLLTIHWVIAHRYYICAVEYPYILNRKEVPLHIKRRNSIMFWTILLLLFISSTYNISNGGYYTHGFC